MTFRITLCITVFALGIGLRAQTANGVSAEEEARRITDRIRGLQAESDRLAGEARTLLADLRKLEAERNVQVQRVQDAQAAIVEIQTAIEGTAQRLLALEAQRIAQLPAMETQLVDMYKRGRSGFARLVLSAGGIREFGRATRAAAAMLRVSEERIAQHRGTAQALGQERAKLEAELDARRAREAEARLAQAAADKAVAERAALLTRVDSQRDVNARLAGELQVEQARLTQPETGRIAAADAPAVSNAPATPARCARADLRADGTCAGRTPLAGFGESYGTLWTASDGDGGSGRSQRPGNRLERGQSRPGAPFGHGVVCRSARAASAIWSSLTTATTRYQFTDTWDPCR